MPVKSILSNAFVVVDKARGKLFSKAYAQTPSPLSDRLIDIAYKLDDRNAIASYKKGLHYAQRENWTEALNAYQDTLQSKAPPPHSFYHHYGLTLLKVGAEAMAKQAFQMSLHHLPEAYWSAYELGLIHHKTGQFAEAEKCFRFVIEQSADHDWAYFYLGQTLLAQGADQHGDEAIDMFLKYAERRPNDPAPYQLLRTATLSKKIVIENCVSRIERLVEKHPDAYNARWGLAWIKSTLSQSDEATALFKELSIEYLRVQKPEITAFVDPTHEPLPPSFIIIGPAKSGAMSLFNWISQHPKMTPPVQNEVRFLDRYYECGFDWYESHFPPVSQNAGVISGEASPSYLLHAKQATVLKEKYPKIKLVVLHRNPVKRAYSHFQMQKRMGHPYDSWSEYIRLELGQLNGRLPSKEVDFSQIKTLLVRSCILPQLQQWLDVFPAEQMLVINSEAMFADPQSAVDMMTEFLGLDSFELPTFDPVNQDYYRPMSAKLENYLTTWFEPHERQLKAFLQEHQLTKLPKDRVSTNQLSVISEQYPLITNH